MTGLNQEAFRLLVEYLFDIEDIALLKSLGTHIARSPHYHVLGPSLVCLSPQVSQATKYLAGCEY